MECIKCCKIIPDDSLYCMYCGWNQGDSPKKRNTKSRGNGTGSIYQLPNGRYKIEVVQGWIKDPATQKARKKEEPRYLIEKKMQLLQSHFYSKNKILVKLYCQHFMKNGPKFITRPFQNQK